MATEVFIIPDGQQNAYFRQFGKLNRIEPIQLKSGDWILPTRVIPMLKKSYVDLKTDKARFDIRSDATLSVCDYAEATIRDIEKFPKSFIEPEDIHSRYKEIIEKEIIPEKEIIKER